MARYIDAEKLCKALRDMAFYQNPYKQSTILGVVSSVECFPTADVAPKREVAREIFAEVKNLLLPLVYLDADGKWHFVKPYASKVHSFVEGFLDLMEKYTEGKT